MRKVMEPSFYYLYLLAIALIGGFLIVQGIRKKKLFWILGIACVTLGLGDAFHLIPRAIGIYSETLDNPSESLAFYLGIGKLITSITMTVFYALLYLYFRKTAIFSKNKVLDLLVCVLFFARIVLLCFPQNEWTTNGSPLDWESIGISPSRCSGRSSSCFASFIFATAVPTASSTLPSRYRSFSIFPSCSSQAWRAGLVC